MPHSESTWRTQDIEWHPVQLAPELRGLNGQVGNWLQVHVGKRGHAWIYPETCILCFRHEHHATQFALTWC